MTARHITAIGVAILVLSGALNGLAQSTPPGFAGRWVRDLPAGADIGTVPNSILRVAMNDQTLAVQEQSAGAETRRSPSYYRLEPQALDRVALVDRVGRTFKWMAPDRIEVHDLMPKPGSRGVAVTESWELREGGRLLRIRRMLQSLDDVAAKPEVRVSTFQRE